jgi:microcystin degradation protein MlrC
VRQQPLTRAILDDLKLSAEDFGIIALKSSVHFRNHYQEIAEAVLVVETPGLVPADPAALPFTKPDPALRLRPAG